MDRRTIECYDRNAADLGAKYRSVDVAGSKQQFLEAFPKAGSRILDVGAGAGRDFALLLSLGYDAWGMEPSEGMREECAKEHPELDGRVRPLGLPMEPPSEWEAGVDGVLCSAVLMHVPSAELFDAAFSVRRLLREGGRLLLSVPASRPGLDSDGRDATGRLFTLMIPECVELLFERLGFRLFRKWEEADLLGRAGIRWSTFLFELGGALGRPLDRIERVLNRDKKWATYKLALFRALSEIGTTQYQQGQWTPGGEVAVPIGLIAQKWFRYYWPIFEAEEFIPQNNGERPGCSKPIAFRRLETKIVEAYRKRGGLSQFLVDKAAGVLPAEGLRLYRETLRCIAGTIREGPVVYASGNMFRYDKSRRLVMVAGGAWKEFCQLGHWIEPAVVLRWAEETNRMSNEEVSVAEALNRLTVARGTHSLTLAWPADAGPFSLHSATNLTMPATWMPVTNEPFLTNGLWIALLPMGTNGQHLFRLQTP